ncbi:Fasciclin-like arabinogalactan protein 14 [Linum grandiflorum]
MMLMSPAECAAPYNITQVLEEYPEYSEFNEILSRSQLAKYINNNERVITVLVTKDVGSVSGKPLASMQAVLSLHVILDYLDATKIRSMKRSVTFTTMFQETGLATGNQGYVNFTKTGGGDNGNQIMIGNGRRDAQLSVSVQKLVMTKTPVLAILEVSGIISAPWADSIKAPPPHSRKKKHAPTPTPSDAPSPSHRRRHRKVAPSSEAGSPPEPDEDPADADADSSAPAPAKNSSPSLPGGFAASLFIGLLASLMLH